MSLFGLIDILCQSRKAVSPGFFSILTSTLRFPSAGTFPDLSSNCLTF